MKPGHYEQMKKKSVKKKVYGNYPSAPFPQKINKIDSVCRAYKPNFSSS